ncbi:hypothetical protein AB0L88_26440 [Saccharopolyspora shandongensis]|uniref:hypothetical protein n=1 Tax=Saccharopolyspora shandongensis TaxID=418495 RepID=UPI003422CDCE
MSEVDVKRNDVLMNWSGLSWTDEFLALKRFLPTTHCGRAAARPLADPPGRPGEGIPASPHRGRDRPSRRRTLESCGSRVVPPKALGRNG